MQEQLPRDVFKERTWCIHSVSREVHPASGESPLERVNYQMGFTPSWLNIGAKAPHQELGTSFRDTAQVCPYSLFKNVRVFGGL